MAIALDASTPVGAISGSSPLTSASFSPPANSLVVVCTSWTGSYSVTATCKDSLANSFSNELHFSQGITGNSAGFDIFEGYYSTAPGNITITTTWSGGSGFDDVYMKVLVLTNCTSSQSGVASGTAHGTSGTPGQVTITPAYTGSWIVSIGAMLGHAGFTISTVNSTSIDKRNITSTNVFEGATGALESGTTAGVNQTVGWTLGSNFGWSVGILEVQQATAPVTVNLTTAKVNVAAPAPVVNIAGLVVPLTTAKVNVAALTPTVTANRITSGGSGTGGNIKITYISPNTQALTYSIAPAASFDPYGNQVPAGYQGPISAMQPGVIPVVTETWHSLALTGASASGNGVNGFFYRYRSDNEVELMWDITLTAGANNICTLPAGYQPSVQHNIQSSWYGAGPGAYSTTFSPHLLVFATTGVIQVENCNGLTISLCGRTKISLDVP
jgi:hypothetical protein